MSSFCIRSARARAREATPTKRALQCSFTVSAVCILISVSLSSERGPALTEILGLAAEADLILIGKPPTQVRALLDRAGKGPRVLVGYRIEPVSFLKGAAQHKSLCAGPFVQLGVSSLGRPRGEELPFQIPPTDVTEPVYIYFIKVMRAAYPHFCRESPLRPQGWFLPATPENIQAVKAALPMPEEWGRVSGGLRLGIRSDKSAYKVGEAIRIDIYVQNLSGQDVVIPQHRLAAEDYYPFTYFQGLGHSRGVVEHAYSTRQALYVVFEKPAGVGQKNVLPLVTLSSGQTYSETVRLDSWQWQTSDAQSPFRLGATWGIKARFEIISIPKELRYRAHEREIMWRGALESNRIDITFR